MEWELPDGQLVMGELIAHMGKPDCVDPRCRRMFGPPGSAVEPGCLGYHCARCDEPCGSQGHSRCPNRAAGIEGAGA